MIRPVRNADQKDQAWNFIKLISRSLNSKLQVCNQILSLSSDLTLHLFWIQLGLHFLLLDFFFLLFVLLSIFSCLSTLLLLFFLSLDIDFRFFCLSPNLLHLFLGTVLDFIEIIAELDVGVFLQEVFVFVESWQALWQVCARIDCYGFPVDKSKRTQIIKQLGRYLKF